MSILDRLNLLIRANVSDVGSSTSSRSGWRSTMRDMESSLRDARRQLAELRVNERKLVDHIRSERDSADKWEDRAMMALKNGEEDLAREALVAKNQIQREVERLHEQLDDHRAYMRDIESSLEALELKLDGTRGRINADRQDRSSRGNRSSGGSVRGERDWDAEMRRRMHSQDDGRDGDSERGRSRDRYRDEDRSSRRSYEPRDDYESRARGPGFDTFDTEPTFREFDRMSHKISSMEAEIDAIRELSDDDDLIDPRKRELDRIFDRMERGKRVENDLSDLKAKFSDD